MRRATGDRSGRSRRTANDHIVGNEGGWSRPHIVRSPAIFATAVGIARCQRYIWPGFRERKIGTRSISLSIREANRVRRRVRHREF
jgi:hypothetical protein